MVGACTLVVGLLSLGLSVLVLRRIISPARFAQALGGVALGLVAAIGLVEALGGRP
nr:hypothetical protein [Brevundimonas diminuta]